MLRRILKWLAVLLGVLAVALVVFVWAVLGVSPLFPKQAHLWELVSNDVNFFVRFPGTRLLDEPIVENLERQRGYEPLLTLREDLARFVAKVGRDVNPQVPLGLFEVGEDALPGDIAFAGSILNDYQRLRPDSFVVLARIPWYGRFVSALRRGFVRNRIPEPWRSRIELVKGSYMRVHLDAQGVDLLDRIRSQQGRADAASVYVARIKDVLVISDNSLWVEHALKPIQGVVLPADPGFLSEFTYTHQSNQDVELYARHSLTYNILQRQVREGSPLFPLTRIVPLDAAGDLTARATPRGDHTIEVDFSNEPFRESIGKMKAHLRDLYELEKGDIRRDFSEEGIGRFIPARNTVAAFVMHVPPERSARPVLVPLIDSMVPADERQLLDDEIRSSSGARFTSLEKLLRYLTEDLSDTHLLIVHRPSAFDGADFSTYRDPPGAEKWTPYWQLSYSLVSRVKDNVSPDEVRKKVFENLQHLGMNAMGVHRSGEFHLAELINQTAEFELAEPAYGAMKGEMRYFVFSTSVEACEAIFRAAEDEDARLVRRPGIAAAVQRLSREGTLGLVVNGDVLHKALRDRVRIYAAGALDVPGWNAQFRLDYKKNKGRDPTNEESRAEAERYTFAEYPRVKEEYEQMLAPLGAVDAVALAATLGVGGDRKIQGKAVIELYPPPEGE